MKTTFIINSISIYCRSKYYLKRIIEMKYTIALANCINIILNVNRWIYKIKLLFYNGDLLMYIHLGFLSLSKRWRLSLRCWRRSRGTWTDLALICMCLRILISRPIHKMFSNSCFFLFTKFCKVVDNLVWTLHQHLHQILKRTQARKYTQYHSQVTKTHYK